MSEENKTPPAVAEFAVAERAELLARIEDLEAQLEDTESRRENSSRNASAFEARMGDLQVENGKMQSRIAELEAHCVRLGQGGAERYWEGRWRDADAQIGDLVAHIERQDDDYALLSLDAGRKMEELERELATLKSQSSGVVDGLHAAVLDAFASFERHGADCFFENNPMVHASILEELADIALSAQPDHSAQSVPDGYVLVPIFPDSRMYGEMIGYGGADGGYEWDEFVRDYTDMLAVAPAPGKQEGGDL